MDTFTVPVDLNDKEVGEKFEADDITAAAHIAANRFRKAGIAIPTIRVNFDAPPSDDPMKDHRLLSDATLFGNGDDQWLVSYIWSRRCDENEVQ